MLKQQIARISVKVCRNERIEMVSGSKLIPGDIVLLSAGDIVPADCRLLNCAQLHLQEGALTGESGSVEKSTDALYLGNLPVWEQRNMAFCGTRVTAGNGMAVVTAVGECTEYGRIEALTQAVRRVPYPSSHPHPKTNRMIMVFVLILLVLLGLFVVLGLLRAVVILSAIPTTNALSM